MRISDWSSDVCSSDLIKVEPAPGGDKTRRLPGFAAGFFLTFNRNKRSIALDLKSDEGRALAHALVAKADVVIENRSEEHTSELQSLMRISYAVFCLKKKHKKTKQELKCTKYKQSTITKN